MANCSKSINTTIEETPSILSMKNLDGELENYIQMYFRQLRQTRSYILPSQFCRFEQNLKYKDDNIAAEQYSSDKNYSLSQGEIAEQIVFEHLKTMKIKGITFYGRPYSHKTFKLGKTIRSFDFLILTSDLKICFLEVKCCTDIQGPSIKKVSNKKSIKDNRRLGLRQLMAHTTFLSEEFGIPSFSVGQLLVWPFLGQRNIHGNDRFAHAKSSEIKHMFKEQIQDGVQFAYFLTEYFDHLQPLESQAWGAVLKRVILLACGTKIDTPLSQKSSAEHVTLLSQEQLSVVYGITEIPRKPLVVNGPPGSGKTRLMLVKISQLWDEERIGKDNMCLFLSSAKSVGLMELVRRHLDHNGIQFTKVESLSNSPDLFQDWCMRNKESFSHIFVDTAHYLYDNFDQIVSMLQTTLKHNCNGHFWFTTDKKQAVSNMDNQMFTHLHLSRTYRFTTNILTFINDLLPDELHIENPVQSQKHGLVKRPKWDSQLPITSPPPTVTGPPPVYFADKCDFLSMEEAVCKLIIDQRNTHGVHPNELVLLTPDIALEDVLDISDVNEGLETYFRQVHSAMCAPKGIVGVDIFQDNTQDHHFCVSSVSEYNGMEANTVIALTVSHKNNSKFKSMMYAMASRCLYLLTLIVDKSESKDVLDIHKIQPYTLQNGNCDILATYFKKREQMKKPKFYFL